MASCSTSPSTTGGRPKRADRPTILDRPAADGPATGSIGMQNGTALTNDELRNLVRPDHVHRRAYVDPAIFDLELERIFGRVWTYVAHESQLRKPGDFVRTRLAANEVLITRDEAGQIHALYNRCPHRGARICMVDRG